MNRSSLRKTLWALTPFVLVALLSAGTLWTAALDAAPANEINIYYYSDSTYTTEVGFRLISCTGNGYFEGTRTPYVIYETYPCW